MSSLHDHQKRKSRDSQRQARMSLCPWASSRPCLLLCAGCLHILVPPATCYDAQWLPTARVLPPHGQDRLPWPPDFRTSQKKGRCPSVGHGWVAGEDASSQGPKRMLTHEAHSLVAWVTSGSSLNLCEPRLPHLSARSSNSIELMKIKHLEYVWMFGNTTAVGNSQPGSRGTTLGVCAHRMCDLGGLLEEERTLILHAQEEPDNRVFPTCQALLQHFPCVNSFTSQSLPCE